MACHAATCQAGHKCSPVLMDYLHGNDCLFYVLNDYFWSGGDAIYRVKHPAVSARYLLWRRKGEVPWVAAAVLGARPGRNDVTPR